MGFCFTRLQDNYSCTQQTNHLLEKKLHCVVKPNLTLHLVPFNPIYLKFTTNSVCFKYDFLTPLSVLLLQSSLKVWMESESN